MTEVELHLYVTHFKAHVSKQYAEKITLLAIMDGWSRRILDTGDRFQHIAKREYIWTSINGKSNDNRQESLFGNSRNVVIPVLKNAMAL